MTQEELKLVLEALKWCHGGEPCGTAEAIAVIEKALAQPKQKPVAWMKRINMPGDDWDAYDFSVNQYGDFQTPLYTTPPQRTWVGLTDEEIDLVCVGLWSGGWRKKAMQDFAKAIEAKLKEKNT